MKRVEFSSDLYRQIKSLPKPLRKEIGEVISQIQEVFGNPHAHRGTGLRKLENPYYEARIGLQWRFVFKNNPNSIQFIFLGNHDEVRRFLKSK